jgi:hypothetical protein
MAPQKNSGGVDATKTRKSDWGSKESVDAVLEQTKGKVKTAARILLVSEASLRHRIKELKLIAQAGTNGTSPNSEGHADAITGFYRSPLYDLSTLTPDRWEQQRPCWYCGVLFAPQKRNCWEQHFCSEEHRLSFNKYGYLPFEKILLALQREIKKEVDALAFESLATRASSEVKDRMKAALEIEMTKLRRYVRHTVVRMMDDPEEVRRELDSISSGATSPQ